MRSPKLVDFAAILLFSVPLAMHAQTAASSQTGASEAGQREPGLYMTFQTDKGNVACKLFEKESPITVGKMVGLAIGKISYIDPRTGQQNRNKFFDGLTFHRVIPGFMIQGGDPLGNGTGSPKGPGFPYQNETSPALTFNVPGRLAMANAGRDTNDKPITPVHIQHVVLERVGPVPPNAPEAMPAPAGSGKAAAKP